MTQEFSPDDPPAGPVDDFSPPAADPRPSQAPASPVYGPPTTVSPKRRPPKRSQSFLGRPAPRSATRPDSGANMGGSAGADGPFGAATAGGFGGRSPAATGVRTTRAAGGRRRARRGPFAWIVDSRGLTFLGAALVAGILGTTGGLISAGTRGWVGTAFTVGFIAGCVLVTLLVHREDLLTVAFLPPLLFVAIATVVGVAQAKIASVPVKGKVIFQVGYAMSFGARTMWEATAATAVLALIMFFVRRPGPTIVRRPPSSPANGNGFERLSADDGIRP